MAAMTAPDPQFMDDRLAHWAAENPDGPAATPEFLGYQGRAHPALPVLRVTAITASAGA